MIDKHNITDALIFLRDLVMCVRYDTVADPGFKTRVASRFICSTFGLDMGAGAPVPPHEYATAFS